MKTIIKIIILALISIGSNCFSQTYRELFDNLDKNNFQSGYYSFYSNFENNLTFEASNVMQAYINMYKVTEDIKYLDEFVIHAKRVMDRRDDRIANAYPVFDVSTNDCPGLSQYASQLQGKVCWSRIEAGCELYPHFMETGIITFPMAEFIILTMDNPDLLTVNLPTEAVSTGITNFGQFADWLKINIYQSLDWQISHDWNNSIGRFVSPYSNGGNAFNQQCAIGRTLILMHYISYKDGNENNSYKSKIELLAYFFYTNLHDANPNNPPLTVNGLPWYTWCHAESCGGNLWEDIAHARLDEEFAELYYKYFHPITGYGRFDITDMQKFANGQADRMFYN